VDRKGGISILTNGIRQELAEVAQLLRVLAEPRRLRMHREMCVCEVLDELGISQPLASHHLRVLHKAGLIQSRRQAQWILYSVVPETLEQIKETLLTHFDPVKLPPEAAYGMGRPRCPNPGMDEEWSSTPANTEATA
jgi:DNA-binding transcriptional ArsR family regulator